MTTVNIEYEMRKIRNAQRNLDRQQGRMPYDEYQRVRSNLIGRERELAYQVQTYAAGPELELSPLFEESYAAAYLGRLNRSDEIAVDWGYISAPSKAEPEKKAPALSEEEVKTKFSSLVAEILPKKVLTQDEQAAHLEEYGTLFAYEAAGEKEKEDYEAKAKKAWEEAQTPPPKPPKRLCGICFDPRCVYSD